MSGISEEGICTNCERTRKIIIGMGICYTCQKAAQGLTGEERLWALAGIREKIMKGEIKCGPRPSAHLKGELPRRDRRKREVLVATGLIAAGPSSIILLFETDADHKLREAIEDMAKNFRRTAEQQIMWICQNEMKIHSELLKEAGKEQ